MSQDPGAFWREQGMDAARRGDRAAASAALERAVQLNPADEDAWFWIAAVQPDPQRALPALERVLALNPQHARALAGRAAVRAHLGLDPAPPPDALPVAERPPQPAPPLPAERASSATPPPPPPVAPQVVPPTNESLAELARRGIRAAQAGRRDEARAALLQVVEQDENNADVWYWLSTALDDPQDVQVALGNAVHLEPDHAEARHALEDLNGEQPSAPAPVPASVLEPAAALSATATAEEAHVPQAEFIGQVLGGRYQVVALFPSGTTVLLMATNIRNGHYVLLHPIRNLPNVGKQSTKAALTFRGVGYSISDMGLAGINLRQFLDTVGTMQAAQASDYGLRLIAEARRGRRRLLERRTWAPEKILINQDGLLDLKAPDQPLDGAPPVTPSPLSPPEHKAGGALDERSDVYLVGAFMYYLLTGTAPPATAQAALPDPAPPSKRGEPASPVVLFPGEPSLPRALAGVLAKALQADPAARYQTLAQLEAALRPLPGNLRGGGATQVSRTAAPKQRNWSGFLTAVAVLLVIGLAGWLFLSIRAGITGNGSNLAGGTRQPGTPGAVIYPDGSSLFASGGLGDIQRLLVNQVDLRNSPQVAVYFSVVAHDEHPIGGLVAANFQLTIDRTPVSTFQVQNVAALTDTLATFLVLDTSNSMEGQPLTQAKGATRLFLQLAAPGDRVGLVALHDTPQLIQDLTISPTLVLTQIDGLEAYGETALYDALDLAAGRLITETGRSSIVLLSDGRDTASRKSLDSVVQVDAAHGIPIHIVGLNDSPDYDHDALQALADRTGGLFYESPDPLQLIELYRRLAYQIRGQYQMTFVGPSTAGPHQIMIRTSVGTTVYSDTTTFQAP